MRDLRHFLDVTDLDASELVRVLDLAEAPGLPPVLSGVGAALVFEKPSNRTRHATEMAVVQLGGHPVYTRGEEVGFDTREPVEDVTRILAGYHAVLCARVFSHRTLERMAAVSTVPVVNLLSDRSHPMQALADVLTMRQLLGPLGGRTVAFVGDWNNVSRSLAEASAMLGMHVRLGCPDGYAPAPADLEAVAGLGAASVHWSPLAEEAVAGADAVHTDVWTSMGQEAEQQARLAAFRGYTVTEALMARAAPGAVFLHCMPAHRGEEVAAEVMDGPRSHAVAQGHNRMHAARGLLAFLLGADR
jgi:ornithine carbamoyltransferase